MEMNDHAELKFTQRKRGGGLMMMMMMMTVMMMMMMATAVNAEDGEEMLDEDELSSSDVKETLSSDVSSVSPLSSWRIFREHSNNNNNLGNNRRSRGSRRTTKHGLLGPRGPPGPSHLRVQQQQQQQQQEVTQELLQKLRDFMGQCVPCDRPRVAASFLGRLPRPISIHRRSLVELLPFTKGLPRGGGFNGSTGRYSVTESGLYLLTASLLIESGDRLQLRPSDSVRAAICIDSLCHTKLSVESVIPLNSAGPTFSILLTGTLYLQVGQYVSVFVDNGTGSSISVLKDSLFSGILVGL